MGDDLFRCRHCKELELKRTPEQRYCSDESCQQARKHAWRRSKLALDPDYRANQRASTKAWLASQGGSGAYYRRYRERRRQQPRCAEDADHVARRAGAPVMATGAKSDVKSQQSRVLSGRYSLLPCGGAKSDAILVELSVVSES